MFLEKFRSTIRFRFLGVMTIVLFVSTLILTVVIAYTEHETLNHALVTHAHSLASFIAKVSKDPLLIKESIQLDAIVNDANKEDIVYTVISDEQGNLLTSQYASVNYRSPRVMAILSGMPKESDLQEIISALKKKETIIEISVPITIDVKTIGKVTMGISGYRIHQEIARTVLSVITINLAVALILGFVLFIATRRIVLDPIADLSRATSEIADDLSARVKVETVGEVKVLADSFNQMLDNLQKVTVSKDYVDNIIKSLMDTLIVVSPEKSILLANNAALTLLGYEEKDLLGRPIEMIFGDVAVSGAIITDEIASRGFVSNIETFYLTKDGDKVPVLFSGSEIYIKNKVYGIVYLARDITERKRAEEEIRLSLREKEALLREIHHRVKNNMAVVSSLLYLQAKKIDNAAVKSLFEESQQRVRSMALVHEKLYQTKDLSSVNFEDYIRSIISEIIGLYLIDTSAITMEIDIQDIELDLESAVPCGLIINELLTNALKYAFPDNRGGVLSVHFTKDGDTYTLSIKDDGVGLPEGFDYKEASTLGLQLVKVLTGQLRGTLQIKSDKGTEAVVTFKTKRN